MLGDVSLLQAQDSLHMTVLKALVKRAQARRVLLWSIGQAEEQQLA